MKKDIKNTKDDYEQTTKLDLTLRPSCRICLKGEELNNKLMKVCKCERHFEQVHRKCIENWIQLTSSEFCDLCDFRFNLKKFKMNYLDYLNLECDNNSNFIFFTILILLVLYVLSIGFVLAYFIYFNISQSIGLVLFCTSTFFTVTFSSYILSRFVNELFKFLKWRTKHFNVRIKKY